MYNAHIFIIAVIILGIIIYQLFYTKRAIVKDKINKTNQKRIADVLDGEEVSIKGKAVLAGRTIKAPFSGRTCVYYFVTVKDNSSQKEVFRNYIDIEEERVGDVVIYDGENYAVINNKLIVAYADKDETQHSGFWRITSDELRAFLKKHGERTSDYMGWSLDLYATEGVIEEGELVAIAGKAKWRNAKDFKIKVPVDKVLYIEPLNEYGVYITDDI